MGRAIKQIGIGPEDVLGAVAVVHVEIDHRHAFGTMGGACVVGGDRGLVEEAEAHGAAAFGMMARRAQGAEDIVGLAREHGIDAGRRRPDRMKCRLQRAGRHGGVGIEKLEALGRRDRLHAAQVLRHMGAQDVFLASGRRRTPRQVAKMI